MNVTRLKNLGSAVERALVGTEKLAPEIQKATRELVTDTGRINQEALGKRKLLGDLLIGKKGTMDALKARYRQGGVVGSGGLILGEFAVDPRYKQFIKNFKEAPKGAKVINPYTGELVTKGKATQMLATKGLGESVNPLFLLGFPAMDIATAASTPDYDEHGGMSGILGALAGGAGFAVGGPLGLVGGLGTSMLGESIGKGLGSMLDPDKPVISLPSTSDSARLPRASDYILDAAVPQ